MELTSNCYSTHEIEIPYLSSVLKLETIKSSQPLLAMVG